MISGRGEEEMGVQRKSDKGERGSSETTKQEQQSQDRMGISTQCIECRGGEHSGVKLFNLC